MLKECLCCHTYCTQLWAHLGAIVTASCTVSNRESRYPRWCRVFCLFSAKVCPWYKNQKFKKNWKPCWCPVCTQFVVAKIRKILLEYLRLPCYLYDCRRSSAFVTFKIHRLPVCQSTTPGESCCMTAMLLGLLSKHSPALLFCTQS